MLESTVQELSIANRLITYLQKEVPYLDLENSSQNTIFSSTSVNTEVTNWNFY